MKAMLVIDNPESCTSCPLSFFNKKWFCIKTNKDIDIGDRYHIPIWCPLKPMPQIRKTSVETDLFEQGVDYGWNACLEELEK